MNGLCKNAKFLVCGVAAGIVNGLFGTGGGLILVPMLSGLAGLDEKRSFATSVTVIVPICVVSAMVYMRSGAVDFAMALPYLAGGILGGFCSGAIFKKAPVNLLNMIFSLLMLYGGIRLVISA